MTISTMNTTSEICPICYINYADKEREDTKKVIQLACHHFYHMDCLASWFLIIEANRQDLFCCYCNQFLMPKKQLSNTFTLQTLQASFERIEKNPDFRYDPYLILCLMRFKSLSDSLLDLLNNDLYPYDIPETIKRCSAWVRDNIEEDLVLIADQLISEIHNGGNALRTLEEEIKHYRRVPYERWPKEIGVLGIPIYHSVNGGTLFRTRISKEYLERAVATYSCVDRRKNESIRSVNSAWKSEKIISILKVSLILMVVSFLAEQVFDF